jgi:exopolysaccharide production protein ExoZ
MSTAEITPNLAAGTSTSESAVAATDQSKSGRVFRAGRLLSIQYARAVAAVSVVFFHACNDAGVTHYPEQVLQAGVDLFFCISGFIMWVTTFQSPISSREFARRRVIRIVPLYWTFTALAVLLAVAAPQLGKRTGATDAIASFFFVPAVNTATGQAQPVIAPGWTLNHEMVFYVIFALALALPRRYRLLAVIGTNAVLALVGFVTNGPLALSFYTNPIILEFVFGVIAGWIYTQGYRLSRQVSTATVIIGALTMIGLAAAWGQTAILRVVVWGLPAAVIVLALALTENTKPVKERPRLLFVGDASYSIYIVHGVLLSAMLSAINHVNGPIGVMIPIGGPLAVVVGLFVYRYIERPMTTRLKYVGYRPATNTAPVSRVPAETAAAVDA